MIYELEPHIRCSKRHQADYAILPGDPARVDRVKSYLSNVKEIASNREFRTIAGDYEGIRILVTSTGIGGPSIGIAVEELARIGVKNFIRIGSCGALQNSLKLGHLVLPSGAVRNDGTSAAYIEKGYPAVPDPDLFFSLVSSAKQLGFEFQHGKIRTHDSFYTDQEQEIDQFWAQKGILASDMESASLFVIGGLRGLKTAAVLNVVVEAEGELSIGINNYVDGRQAVVDGEQKEILTALNAIVVNEKIKNKYFREE